MPSVTVEWGLRGVETLRDHVSVLVIVDVLSFSIAVDVAVSRGAAVHPFAYGDKDAQATADRLGAVLAEPRRASGGQFSLSPVSLQAILPGTQLLLPSPNGSRLSLACGSTRALTGCLRNARAVARAARDLAGDGAIGVVPAGERWPDGGLRPAIEDLLGAGVIVQHLGLLGTPEARVARDAFLSAGGNMGAMVAESVSGRELATAGFLQDVEMAVQQDVSEHAPMLIDGAYRSSVACG
ncbi:MAG: 2-phosphosulfolactate phosphatase [Proteobacteria bacterium]|nr:2-phosphosulfolactate phosphatase [Pseudomonadota bacterium]